MAHIFLGAFLTRCRLDGAVERPGIDGRQTHGSRSEEDRTKSPLPLPASRPLALQPHRAMKLIEFGGETDISRISLRHLSDMDIARRRLVNSKTPLSEALINRYRRLSMPLPFMRS